MKRHFEENITSYIAGFLGMLIFVVVYGPYVINPFYTDFLKVTGDLGQHYYGWELFRISDWFVYPGLMNSAAYPYEVSVIFTDSIPLVAVLVKWFLNGMNVRIQYFGIWELLCFFLQGFFGAKLIKEHTDNKCMQLIGAMLFVLMPCMLRRVFYHVALSSQFLILIGMLLLENARKYSLKKSVIYWGILGFLCAGIHIYFIAICGLVFVGAFIYDAFDGIKGIIKGLLSGVAFVGFSILCVFMLGGMVSGMDKGAPGVGYYSLNFISFIMADDGWSKLLPPVRYYNEGQYEGFVYLGLGTIIIVLLSLCSSMFLLLKKRNYNMENLPWVIVLLLSLITASGGIISFGEKAIFEPKLSQSVEQIWSVVRASGRLGWVSVYIILLFAFVSISKFLKYNEEHWHKKMIPILVYIIMMVAFVLQIIDLYPKLSDRNKEYARMVEYDYPLMDEYNLLRSVGKGRKHIVLLNKDILNQTQLYGFAEYAVQSHMTINDFYFARNFLGNVPEVADDFAKRNRQDCIFVLEKSNWQKALIYDLNWYETDSFYIGVAK